jgi:hypothetical protein
MAAPSLGWARLGGETVLFWSDPTALLEESDSPTHGWQNSPLTSSPVVLGSVGGPRFFRLRRTP